MTDFHEGDRVSSTVRDEALYSMFSDALGYEISKDTVLTPDEELVAGVEVQGRIDSVSEQMCRLRDGKEVDLDILMDSKAQLAIFEQWRKDRF